MSLSSTKNSSPRYGLVVLLVLALFLCALFFYVRYTKGDKLTNDINQLSVIKENFKMLDSCVVVLYNADNNSRLYAVTGEKAYIQKFAQDINFVSNTLKGIKDLADENGDKIPKTLSSLVDQKRTRTELYLKLRKLTDSLINTTSGIDTTINKFQLKAADELTYKQFKTMITIDTIEVLPEAKKEKSFMGRVGDLFKRKKVKSDTVRKYVKTETKLDTSLESRNYNRAQLKNINNYFRNLYAANHMLKKNEVVILQLNKKIITEMVSLLQDFKNQETAFIEKGRSVLRERINNNIKSTDYIFLLSVGLLITIVMAILYNLWKIYKNESELINHSHQASQYALSKSRFLANMSHEIRTPLNSVIGFSEQLSQGELNSQQTEQVGAIRSSSVMLLDVVNDILDFSKYETGKVNFDKIPFSPLEAINEVFNSIAIQATIKKIELKRELSFKQNLCFSGDSLRLKQVVMNLLSNAIKFTDKGGVTVKADVIFNSKKGLLKVQIIDTGIGIGTDDIDMIFDEFAQVYYSSNKIKQAGTGLGLAICKRIVEFQGGHIGVTSELGKGSIFSFEIPYDICVASEGQSNKNLTKISTIGLEGKRILLADDNKMNILLAQTVIKKYKMITDVCYNGKEALELFKLNHYDLLLTDIQMPEMGGLELTKTIRAFPDQLKAKMPILGVTANVLEEDRKKYIESGIDDLVLKPFSEKELIEKMGYYLKKD